jgi:hypothetical protein
MLHSTQFARLIGATFWQLRGHDLGYGNRIGELWYHVAFRGRSLNVSMLSEDCGLVNQIHGDFQASVVVEFEKLMNAILFILD